MPTTVVEVEGVGEIEASQKFTTVVRYVDKAESENKRLQLKTPNGRVAFKADQVKLVREQLGEGEEPEEPEERPQDEADSAPEAEEPEESPVEEDLPPETEGGKSPFGLAGQS